MSEIKNNYAVAVVVFHFKAKVYRASSPKCRFKITSTNEWVSRKKKGLYFVYFNHYKHPKGEKVPKKKEKFGFIWYVPIQYLYFKQVHICSTPKTILKADN